MSKYLDLEGLEYYHKNAIPKNSGAHNSLYRGKDITDLFYDGTLSQQIAAQTFDDIFIGDYIIGKTSGRKYLVADINYRLNCGDVDKVCTTPHILMIPEKVMGLAQMNSSNTTSGAYIGSAMYKTHLATYKTIIQNDFGTDHILTHYNYFANAVTSNYESAGAWASSTIELMNELMVYGSNVFHNAQNGTNWANSHTIDKAQLSLFRHRKDLIVAFDDDGARSAWWLRDVASSATFATVYGTGNTSNYNASYSAGVRPAFLIY